MITFEVDLAQLKRQWGREIAHLALDAGSAVQKASEASVQRVKDKPTFKRGKGKLQASGRTRLLRAHGRGAMSEALWTARHASYVDRGTPPHDIWPKAGVGFVGPTRREVGRAQRRRSSGKARTHLRIPVATLRQPPRTKVHPGGFILVKKVEHPGIANPARFSDDALTWGTQVCSREIEAALIRFAERLRDG